MIVNKLEFKGKGVIVDGARRLKLNIYDAIKKEWIRSDYPELKADFLFSQEAMKLAAAARGSLNQLTPANRVIRFED